MALNFTHTHIYLYISIYTHIKNRGTERDT